MCTASKQDSHILRHMNITLTSITLVSQITSYSTVCSTDCLGKNQHQWSWPFVRGIHQWPKASNAENISISWRYHEIFHWSTYPNMHPFKSHPIIKKAVGPMLVQRWHTTIGVTLCQRWPNISVPTLGRCWCNVGPTLACQCWANWQIHVGPTSVCRRWPNVRVDVGPTSQC